MSIDELGRAAATEARQRAAEVVAPRTTLAGLQRTRRVRSVTTAVAVTASVVAVAVVGSLMLTGGPTASHGSTPGAPGPSPSSDRCADPLVTCLGDWEFRVALDVPVTVTLPTNFEGTATTFGADTLEDYRTDVDQTGVTVIEDATPVKDGASWTPDPAAGTTAHSMATWLLHRPFLTNATMTRATVGDRSGWRVSADLKDDAELSASKGSFFVAPTFMGDTAKAGYGSDLKGDYTLLDVSGAGVTVIWSWTLQPDRSVLADNKDYVACLTFG